MPLVILKSKFTFFISIILHPFVTTNISSNEPYDSDIFLDKYSETIVPFSYVSTELINTLV
jgi:hypothetical protein